jgi:hypothetical protein
VAAAAPIAPSNKPTTTLNGKPSLTKLLEAADISPLHNLNSKHLKQRPHNFKFAAIDLPNYLPADVRGNRSTDTSHASSMQHVCREPQLDQDALHNHQQPSVLTDTPASSND